MIGWAAPIMGVFSQTGVCGEGFHDQHGGDRESTSRSLQLQAYPV